MTKLETNMTISVVIGSTRQGRFSEKPAQWILTELRKREAVEARLLDLRDFPMPFYGADQIIRGHSVATLWAHFHGGDGGQGPRRTGEASQGHDRRSALVDCGPEDGA